MRKIKSFEDFVGESADVFGTIKKIFADKEDHSVTGTANKFTISNMFDVDLDEELEDSGADLERPISAGIDIVVTKEGEIYKAVIKADANHKEVVGWGYNKTEEPIEYTEAELLEQIEEAMISATDEHYADILQSLKDWINRYDDQGEDDEEETDED